MTEIMARDTSTTAAWAQQGAFATSVLSLALVLACSNAKDENAPDANTSTTPDASVPGQQDASTKACTTHANCADVIGAPPLPEFPCGNCWAACNSAEVCELLCVEGHSCMFTGGGCGPECEPLCESESDCYDGAYPCTNGVCQLD